MTYWTANKRNFFKLTNECAWLASACSASASGSRWRHEVCTARSSINHHKHVIIAPFVFHRSFLHNTRLSMV